MTRKELNMYKPLGEDLTLTEAKRLAKWWGTRPTRSTNKQTGRNGIVITLSPRKHKKPLYDVYMRIEVNP